jgi:RimJ/RimL family protein N-acetyltransferase
MTEVIGLFDPESICRMVRITLRAAGWRDVWRLWRWRNDPTTRAMSRSREPVGFVNHVRWLRALWRDSSRQLYVAEANGSAVGSGRIDYTLHNDMDKLVGEVSLVIAARWRGYGYATTLVRLLYEAADQRGAQLVVGYVRRENLASLSAFQRAGFHQAKWDDLSHMVRLERRCA